MDKAIGYAIDNAVKQAIQEIGLKEFKKTSMFMSNNRSTEQKAAA